MFRSLRSIGDRHQQRDRARQAWGNGAFQEIVVVFGDSQDSGELLPPALRLDLPAEQAP
jgi:hypothetical protein